MIERDKSRHGVYRVDGMTNIFVYTSNTAKNLIFPIFICLFCCFKFLFFFGVLGQGKLNASTANKWRREHIRFMQIVLVGNASFRTRSSVSDLFLDTVGTAIAHIPILFDHILID